MCAPDPRERNGVHGARPHRCPTAQRCRGPKRRSGRSGYGPSQLQSAYKLPSSTAGKKQIVAVVDAYNDPKAVSDFNTYRSSWGLPACNTTTKAGCLTVVNENGATVHCR